jgi:C-terminal processing protease CtpA/Prc
LTTNYKSARPRIRVPRRGGAGACACLLAFAAFAIAQVPSEQDRLIQTAKVWIAVKYFYPALAQGNTDWNQALVDALPKIRAANNQDEYAAALESMLKPVQGVVLRENQDVHDRGHDAAAQRTWVHHGFPPESGHDSGLFYSAFVLHPLTAQLGPTTIPLGAGLRVQLNLYEDISSRDADSGPAIKRDRYPADPYPSTEYRILAAFKTWGVIHHFFAYRDLMDEDWDEVFASFLPRFIAAKDAREYNLTLADMLTHTLDSQVTVRSNELDDYFGRATVGLRLRLIEKKPVVTEILDPAAASSGLKIGYIVAKIDGESVPDRFNRIQDYLSGGTPQRRGYDSLQRVLSGTEGSTATLLISGDEGPAKEVKLRRGTNYTAGTREKQPDEPIRSLRSNVGYVDLTRLPDDQVSAIFEKLQNARAIIFDARGPVSAGARIIPSHLTSTNDVAGAIITGPITLWPDVITTRSLTSTASYFFVEKLPDPVPPKYTGKTVMLTDERTIAEAEHLGLWLEAANNTGFIGTASAGADGETTNFVLPGGITVTFSGQDIRHGNTGKLQRLGLQPAVLVAPTIKGIRAGRDEVLEKAIEYLNPENAHAMRARLE